MLYLILLLPAALAVCCCVLRPDGGRRARRAARGAGRGASSGAPRRLPRRGACLARLAHERGGLTFSLRLDRLAGFFCLLTAACWLLTMVYARAT